MKDGHISRIQKGLTKWCEKESITSRFMTFYIDLLAIGARAEDLSADPTCELNAAEINNRLSKKMPLLTFEKLDISWLLVEDIFTNFFNTFADYPDIFGELDDGIFKKEIYPKLPRKAVQAWFENKNLPDNVVLNDINEYLLEILIHETMRPFLISHAQVLRSSVNRETWRRPYCPICGGVPDFAFLEKEVATRWLVCARCDTEWLFQRLECPYCGNKDNTSLSFFSDKDGTYRLYICENCHTYLKAIDLNKTYGNIFIPLERLITFHMDQEGQKRGYKTGGSRLIRKLRKTDKKNTTDLRFL